VKSSHTLFPPEYKDSELVIGLVGAVGTPLQEVQRAIEEHLRSFRYHTQSIRVSELIAELGASKLRKSPAYERYSTYMNGGNQVRKATGQGNVLALAAIQKIATVRTDLTSAQKPTAFVVRSLKHPDEVDALRAAYGPGFFLIGVYAPKHARLANLNKKERVRIDRAKKLIARDEAEPDRFGQRTREVFERADAFVDWSLADNKVQLERVIDLLFGHPYVTPTLDEQAMFQAYAASLRSADLSRQVGAVVRDACGDFVAVGANDVPRFGGGLYWPGKGDLRDHKRGYDSNQRQRDAIVEAVLKGLGSEYKDANHPEVRAKLADTGLLDITEYGRAVHAEMEALLACARTGRSPRGGTLYTTTFPCHNCAKHVVAAGIARVVYVEPYPKSRAQELHDDAIEVEPESQSRESNKVQFEPFVGIGPRRFVDLFSMRFGSGRKLRRKNDNGDVMQWDPQTAKLRIPLLETSYLERESVAKAALFELKGRLP
jgi:deoxycytidylate deaminase